MYIHVDVYVIYNVYPLHTPLRKYIYIYMYIYTCLSLGQCCATCASRDCRVYRLSIRAQAHASSSALEGHCTHASSSADPLLQVAAAAEDHEVVVHLAIVHDVGAAASVRSLPADACQSKVIYPGQWHQRNHSNLAVPVILSL